MQSEIMQSGAGRVGAEQAGAVQSDTFQFQASDGARLHVYRWKPDQTVVPRGLVLIAHGLAEHAARYAETAGALVRAGFVVYAPDHRGHGKTVELGGDLGFFGPEKGWERVISDLAELARSFKSEHAGLPLFLLGHSMGSFLSQHLMITVGEEFAGVILVASNGKIGPLRAIGYLIAQVERMRLGPKGRSKLLHFMSFGEFNKSFKPARTDFEWLCRRPDVVDAYIADPKCGFIATTTLWRDFLYGLGLLEEPANQGLIPKSLPVLIIAGERDPVSKGCTGLVKLIEAYKAVGMTQVQHKFYPQARHEILNETNREEVWADIIAWMDQVLASRPRPHSQP